MSDNKVIRDLTLQGLEQKEVVLPNKEKAKLLLHSRDCSVADLEQYQSAPNRIKADEMFESIESFSDYISSFGSKATMIKVFPSRFYNSVLNDDEDSFYASHASLDYHLPESPSWCNHDANLVLYKTVDFTRWMAKDKMRFSQLKFAQWLADNAQNIVEPDLSSLIKMVKKYNVVESSDVTSVVDNHKSASQSFYKLEGADLPEFLTLKIKPVRFFKSYQIKARLVVEISELNKPQFSYQLINVDSILDHMIDDLCSQIKSMTGIVPSR